MMTLNVKYIDDSTKVLLSNFDKKSTTTIYDYITIKKYNIDKKNPESKEPVELMVKSVGIGERGALESFVTEIEDNLYDKVISEINFALPKNEKEKTWIEMKGVFFDEKGLMVHAESYFRKLISLKSVDKDILEIKNILSALFLNDTENQRESKTKKIINKN